MKGQPPCENGDCPLLFFCVLREYELALAVSTEYKAQTYHPTRSGRGTANVRMVGRLRLCPSFFSKAQTNHRTRSGQGEAKVQLVRGDFVCVLYLFRKAQTNHRTRSGRGTAEVQLVGGDFVWAPIGERGFRLCSFYSTLNCPIMPLSSCSRMWQWYMKMPGCVNRTRILTSSPTSTKTVSLNPRSSGGGTSPSRDRTLN